MSSTNGPTAVAERPPGSARRVAEFLALTLVFGVACTQLPLFSSNQTHHFLAGLARAGLGWLRDDWQVHTADPFPVFTAIVAFVHGRLGDWWFYAAYQALISAYIWGVLGIIGLLVPACAGGRLRLVFFTLFTAIHSEGFGYVLGFNPARMPWWQMFTWGVAEQEIFGHAMFQGSAFGMLLPLAVLLFLRGRPWWGATLAGLTVIVHPGYALLAGCLVSAFVISRAGTPVGTPVGAPVAAHHTARGGLGGAMVVAAWFGLLAAPVLADAWIRFAPTDPETWRQATAVLVRHLPRETSPFLWYGTKAWLQIALMVAGTWAARKTALGPYLIVPLIAGGVLSAAQFATGSPSLALAFPWRVSVWLVPVSTAFLLARGIAWLAARSPVPSSAALARLAVVSLVLLVLGGVLKMTLHAGYFYGLAPVTRAADGVIPASWIGEFAHDLRPDALAVLRFVRETRARGDTYVIPLDLERFRVDTGAPAYADLKSHPYKDREVLAWNRRIETVRRILGPGPDCQALEALGRAGEVTHVVAPLESAVRTCPDTVPIFADGHFIVLKLAARGAEAP